MPKMKTRKSTAKRFRLTAGGEVRRNKSNKRHILTHKSRKRKRQLRKSTLVDPADRARIRRQLVK
jgi:large subunit ribosomal protein L35